MAKLNTSNNSNTTSSRTIGRSGIFQSRYRSNVNNSKMALLAIDLVSIELFLLLFMVCFVNNICNGVVAVGNAPNIANGK